MNCGDSPWLFAVWAFCFAEDTFLCHQILIANFEIIVNLLAIYASRVKISLTLPVISNYVPVGYEWNVKEHIVSKYCRTWRGFKECVIGRANGPCCVVKEDINLIRGYCLGQSSSEVCNIFVLGLDVSAPKLHFACGLPFCYSFPFHWSTKGRIGLTLGL
jgi:hypothetical protein